MNETPAQLLSRKWGLRLAKERKAAGYTQATFAERVARDQPWISRYERGVGSWTLDTMLLFAAALGVPVSDLFEFPMGIEAMEQFRLGLVA